jgi:hypothetical protein
MEMAMAKPLLLVVDYCDGLTFELATMEELAGLYRDRERDADFDLVGVYALGRDRAPVAVPYWVEGADKFDENDWAYPVVKVTMPDGSTLSAGYRIDGRA